MFLKKKDKVTAEMVLNALSQVMDPDLHKDVVSLGMISDISISGPKVHFKLTLTTPACPVKEQMESQCREAVAGIDGVQEVEMESTATVAGARDLVGKEPVEGIKQIIAVTSGKGGVGKTTVSVNLAVALAQLGAKVGVLDADITGPNVPLMLGVGEYQPTSNMHNKITPPENFGIKCMSIAFFVDRDTPVIWRGPMLDKAIKQFLRDVEWGELDYLIVDMPPGTGDAQLTLTTATQVSGVLVTTPQDVALLDVRRGYAMFEKMKVPVLGLIENMSYFSCPECHTATHIFGSAGGRALANEMQLPLLGEIPIDIGVREGGDAGRPITATNSEHPISRAYIAAAKQVAAQVSIKTLASVFS